MARPKKTDSETYSTRLYVRLHPDDKRRIQARAKAAGLSVSDYLRQLGCDGKIEISSPTGPDVQTVLALNRIGNNLNQIAKAVNSGGAAPPSLVRLLDRLNAFLDEAMEFNSRGSTSRKTGPEL